MTVENPRDNLIPDVAWQGAGSVLLSVEEPSESESDVDDFDDEDFDDDFDDDFEEEIEDDELGVQDDFDPDGFESSFE